MPRRKPEDEEGLFRPRAVSNINNIVDKIRFSYEIIQKQEKEKNLSTERSQKA